MFIAVCTNDKRCKGILTALSLSVSG